MIKICFTPFPVLNTERLTLRQLETGDENELMLLRSDEKVNEFIIRPKKMSSDEARATILKLNSYIKTNESITWVINLKEDDKLIGTICLWNLYNVGKNNSRGEVGFELHPYHQGKGLIQEALAAVLDYGFIKMGLKTIEGFANVNNIRSIRLMERFKFKRNPERKKELEGEEEDFVDMCMYTLAVNS